MAASMSQTERLRLIADRLDSSGLTVGLVSVYRSGAMTLVAMTEADCEALAAMFDLPAPQWESGHHNGVGYYTAQASDCDVAVTFSRRVVQVSA